MRRSRTPRRLIALAVVAIALSVIRVTSAPPSAEPTPGRTFGTALEEVRADVQATVAGLGRERAYWETHVNRMRADTRLLEQRLAGSSTFFGKH